MICHTPSKRCVWLVARVLRRIHVSSNAEMACRVFHHRDGDHFSRSTNTFILNPSSSPWRRSEVEAKPSEVFGLIGKADVFLQVIRLDSSRDTSYFIRVFDMLLLPLVYHLITNNLYELEKAWPWVKAYMPVISDNWKCPKYYTWLGIFMWRRIRTA